MDNGLTGQFTQEAIQPAKLKTGRIALVDADRVKYIVTSKIFKDIEKIRRGELQLFLKEDPVVKYTKEWVESFLMKIDDPIIFCFSAPSAQTFRHSASFEKPYKGNRKKDSQEYPEKISDMYEAMKYVIDKYVSLITDDLEADDILSMLQDPEKTYIVSNDKDLKTVPGFHYNFSRNTIEEITPKKALYTLSMQLLTGDTTDNICGLPGCGPVKAEKILAQARKHSDYLMLVLNEYQRTFGIFKGTDMFTEIWMLVKMRENRGTHFLQKHQRLFDTKQMLLNEMEKDKLK